MGRRFIALSDKRLISSAPPELILQLWNVDMIKALLSMNMPLWQSQMVLINVE